MAKVRGIFVVSTCLAASDPNVLLKLGNSMSSVFSGETGNKIPVSFMLDLACNIGMTLKLRISKTPLSQGTLCSQGASCL